MSPLWHGKETASGELALGLPLAQAGLAPDFAYQWLNCGLFTETQNTLIAPLDDLKQWLRATSSSESEHFGEIRGALLGDEARARQAAKDAGEKFDLVDYELAQMQGDATYERFDPEWTRALLSLFLDEADSLNAFTRAEYKQNALLSVSFTLPPPSAHPEIKPEEAEKRLLEFGASPARAQQALRKNSRIEWTGALQLELLSKGAKRDLTPARETGFVDVKMEDPRVTDLCDLSLCVAYPREWEGYFLAHFDLARKRLALKDVQP